MSQNNLLKIRELLKTLSSFELRELKEEFLKDLFCFITSDDVLKWEQQKMPDGRVVGNLKVARETLSGQAAAGIISGAKMLKDLDLWKYLLKDLRYQANLNMYNNSQSLDALQGGKAVLWVIEKLEEKVAFLSALDLIKK